VRIADWSGAYLGIHGGVIGRGFKSSNATPNIPALKFSGRRNTQSLSGGAFGVQAGYNFQTGPIVYGLEAETTLGTGTRKKSATHLSAEQNARHALKARLGYSFGSTLVYATTGVALVQTRLQSPAVGLTPAGRKNISQTGLLVGLGVEQKLTEQIAVKGEVDYAAFGQKSVRFPSGTTKVDSGIFTAKVGLNYHF
jgi:outer membrane immunogenic protein